MDNSWRQLTLKEPALLDLEKEVQKRASSKRGGRHEWFSVLWYGNETEVGIKSSLSALVGGDRGKVSSNNVPQVPSVASPGGLSAREVIESIDWEKPERDEEMADLFSSEAYDIAYQYLANLLRVELDKAPLPYELPLESKTLLSRKLSAYKGLYEYLLYDYRVAALCALLNLKQGHVLTLVKESIPGEPERLTHATFTVNGLLVGWDVTYGKGRGDLSLTLDKALEVVLDNNKNGKDWSADLFDSVKRANAAWAGAELANACGGYLEFTPSRFAIAAVSSKSGNLPRWVGSQGYSEIIALMPVVEEVPNT